MFFIRLSYLFSFFMRSFSFSPILRLLFASTYSLNQEDIPVGITHYRHDGDMALNIIIIKHIFLHIHFCLVQRAIINSELGETVTIIKRETNDECLGDGVGGVSTTMALGIHLLTKEIFGNNHELLDCVVCGDRATGND